ncbi:DUF4959 domain-containing protein [Paradesertivirga mongoliensis]|uniref:DUF4959 domain-containing protein n=1 Tax=Paradesertivirga mongoliensis TaxID=2100740 RepID=A0ABW4ZM11_9SPHI|nr:DUF5000 domain-containing lipoprotein [Pedobacter mongoliensis]
MKIFQNKMYIVLFLALLIGTSCQKEVEFRAPAGSDSSVPSQISNTKAISLPGKVKITYRVPADENLLYVKAEYQLKSGVLYETKSSIYTDTITIEGFADTLEHEVKLYSVSKNEVASAPVIVKVRALEAPFVKVFKSIVIQNAFGGYNLQAQNAAKDNIAILVMKRNDFNEFEVDNHKSVRTRVEDIISKIRGLDTINQELAVFVKDKWGNSSDTIYTSIKPIFEQEFPAQNFRGFRLPGDAPQVYNGARLEYAWDGRLGWPWTSFTHQIDGGPNPHMITFDMGTKGKISRVYIRPFPEGNRWYYLTTMKRFEIYGSLSPSANGDLDNSWTLLGSFENKKPSGLPYGNDSADDQAIASAGFNYEIDVTKPEARYIRIRCLENFAGGTAQSINEIKIYGSPTK